MSKAVNVEEIQPDPGGPKFGVISDPAQFRKSQDFAHEHIEIVTLAALMAGGAGAKVHGFALNLTGALGFSVASGYVLSLLGKLYETAPEATALTLSPAHPTQPRIDLVYALLEEDVAVDYQIQPFRRLREAADFAAVPPLAPWPPTTFNRPTEFHTRATVMVREGVAAGVPAAPAAGANEVPLFQITVPAAAANLVLGNVVDVRPVLRSLLQALTLIDAAGAKLGTGGAAPAAGQFLKGTGAGASAWSALTLAEVLAALGFTPVNKAGDSMASHLNIYGAAELNPGVLQTILTVYPHPAGSFSNFPVLEAIAVGNTSGDANKRAGSRLQISGDYIGNPIRWRVDIGTPDSVARALMRITNGITFQVSEIVAGSTGSGFVFRNIDQPGIGLNAVMVVQKPDASSAFHVLNSGAARFYNNLAVDGSLSKGSGTFLIDHPLVPEEKNLYHAFIEAPVYGLRYTGRTKLSGGKATVNIDKASRMTQGTFERLVQRADVLGLLNRSGFARVRASEIVNGQFEIICEDKTSNDEVAWEVAGERKDPFIYTVENVDKDGRLVPEWAKPVATKEEMERATAPRVVTREGAEPAADQEHEEIAHELIGKRGYPMHAERTSGKMPPPRRVVTRTVVPEQAQREPEGE